jgi:hypothetical protein
MALLVGLPESTLVDGSGVLPSRHHPPSFSMLIYYLGDEKQARRWLQFRDVVSPHQHDDDDDHYHHHQVTYSMQAHFIQFEYVRQIGNRVR